MASAELRGFWGNGAGRVIVSNVQSPALAEIWCRVPAAQGSANRRTRVREKPSPARPRLTATFTFAGKRRIASSAVPLNSSRASGDMISASSAVGGMSSERGGIWPRLRGCFTVVRVTASSPISRMARMPSSPAMAPDGTCTAARAASTSRNRAGSSENPPTLNGTTAFPAARQDRTISGMAAALVASTSKSHVSMSCCRPSTGTSPSSSASHSACAVVREKSPPRR